MKARKAFFKEDENSKHYMPSPAPKLSRTPARLEREESDIDILTRFGLSGSVAAEIVM
jgi:hypothetical protein